ncbi:MAG TPA: PQQ-dependent sugar dehydrogenase, partial [Solirubrobacterales bacterium]|nr:PQQ-dependent sugar dehydrogenase [Solirubrobacterales bacterium]
GGQLQLGPDGHLYLSTGDGGGAGDPEGDAQDPASLLGKIIRIDPADGSTEVWASGLRNPWRFSFDRLTGTMVIADVGQELREEIDLGVAGANYGWNCREGFIAYPGAPPSCAGLSFTEPVFDYPHDDPGNGAAFGCSIVGGYVVRDPSVPELYGRYLYADFCEEGLRSLVLPSTANGLASDDRPEGLSAPQPVSFGEDAAGRVYVVANEGLVYRLVGAPTPAPPPQPPATAPRSRPLIVLQARKRGRRTVKLIVRVLPCEDRAGEVVYVNRNGREFRHRRLDRHCVARFRVRVRGRTRFRAFFEGQRSQVRKIAFAKPRP